MPRCNRGATNYENRPASLTWTIAKEGEERRTFPRLRRCSTRPALPMGEVGTARIFEAMGEVMRAPVGILKGTPQVYRQMIIAVIGSSNPASAEHVKLAEAVGRELAKRGAMVVCGGLTGVMEAVCRGAKSEGGVTIGILPGDSVAEANPYVDIPIVTRMGYARNVIVVHSGRAVIAVGGAYGTLSEIGHALGDGIPVVGLKTWNLSLNGDGQPVDGAIIRAYDPVDAVEKALAAAAARDRAEAPARAG